MHYVKSELPNVRQNAQTPSSNVTATTSPPPTSRNLWQPIGVSDQSASGYNNVAQAFTTFALTSHNITPSPPAQLIPTYPPSSVSKPAPSHPTASSAPHVSSYSNSIPRCSTLDHSPHYASYNPYFLHPFGLYPYSHHYSASPVSAAPTTFLDLRLSILHAPLPITAQVNFSAPKPSDSKSLN